MDSQFCLRIASETKEFITNKESKALVETVINKCLNGLNNNCNIAHELYEYLIRLSIYQENETDEKAIAAWDAIIDAIAIICRNAYLEAGAEYFPEPIELVDDDTVDHMLNSFLSVSEDDLEINIQDKKVLRLWTAAGCAEMNEAHHIQKYLPNAWAIGDDEGGFAIIRVKNHASPGLYAVSFSDLDDDEKIFLAHSIPEFLFSGVGMDIFLDL